MPSRRSFMKTVTGAAAGLAMARSFSNAYAQAPAGGQRRGGGGARQIPQATGPVTRREVKVGGRRVRVIDIHAHATVDEVKPVVANTEFARQAGGRALDMQRIQEMDSRGIDVQALSINGYWWYAVKDRGLADRIVRAADEGLASWCKEHSDRFLALTSPSLQFPDLAAAQVEHAVKDLGHRGASLGGHVNGESLSLAKYDPFWAKCQELGVPVFMHPGGADNVLKENAWAGTRGDLGNIIGNPLETTVFLTRLIFDGTLDKFPNLKIVAAHGGGYLPSYIGRTEVACQVRNNANCANNKRPSTYFSDQIFVDAMVFSPEGVRHLVEEVGASQVVYGTDIPLLWPDAIDNILAAKISDDQKEMILGGNLTKLLKL
jgi:aminocarboxymuconate-semialdehyde decarboxylase